MLAEIKGMDGLADLEQKLTALKPMSQLQQLQRHGSGSSPSSGSTSRQLNN